MIFRSFSLAVEFDDHEAYSPSLLIFAVELLYLLFVPCKWDAIFDVVVDNGNHQKDTLFLMHFGWPLATASRDRHIKYDVT